MGTHRLAFFSQPVPIRLKEKASLSRDIEVPAGESSFLIQTPSGNAEQEYIFHLRYPDSRVRIIGKMIARGKSTPTLHTKVIHHTPYTQAETVIHTLAYDQAQPHYQGVIRIEKDAQGSESYLNHHSLLLDEKARSWTLPSLEILANQVKCSHAATIRTITELDLFYLRTRGMSAEQARQLLIKAFLQEATYFPNSIRQ